jgi:hypothetical protein
MSAVVTVDSTVELDVQQGIVRRVGDDISVAAITAIATVGSAFRAVLLTQEAAATVTTIASFYI